MASYSYELKIPQERVAVLIGKNGEVKKNIEEDKDIEEIKTREYGKPVLVQDQDEEIKVV